MIQRQHMPVFQTIATTLVKSDDGILTGLFHAAIDGNDLGGNLFLRCMRLIIAGESGCGLGETIAFVNFQNGTG